MTVYDYLPATHPWANRIHSFDCVESTNTLAKEMAKAGAPHGTVVIADRQTAGRGRLGRSFFSPGGMGIYMSVILRYDCDASQLMHLTCACGVSVCNALEAATQVRPSMKWINDLVYNKKKLAGILTELVTVEGQLCAIVGIGINCCQQVSDFDSQIRDLAISVAMITGEQPNRFQLAAEIIQSLWDMDQRLLTQKATIMDTYRADCITLGQPISVLRGDVVEHGTALDILEDGALLVAFSDGHRAVNSGEVSVRGMYGYI